jgi:hypothetical protein
MLVWLGLRACRVKSICSERADEHQVVVRRRRAGDRP